MLNDEQRLIIIGYITAPLMNRHLERIDHGLATGHTALTHYILHTVDPELRPVGIHRLGKAVRVLHQHVSGVEDEALFANRAARKIPADCAERDSGGAQALDLSGLSTIDQDRIVACRGERE